MRDVKSLAAEIEAVILRYFPRSPLGDAAYGADRQTNCAAEIAANQSRAFEDGARWMRERAAEAAKHRYSPLNLERFTVNGEVIRDRQGREVFMPVEEADRHVSERVEAIQALPLQPEGERSDA